MAKILLVEDNEMNRDMLSRRLIRRGYEVLIAVDGAQGVAMAASESPQLILMDMSLPVLDGWEATRQVKANEATRAIPVIALTAHASTATWKRSCRKAHPRATRCCAKWATSSPPRWRAERRNTKWQRSCSWKTTK